MFVQSGFRVLESHIRSCHSIPTLPPALNRCQRNNIRLILFIPYSCFNHRHCAAPLPRSQPASANPRPLVYNMQWLWWCGPTMALCRPGMSSCCCFNSSICCRVKNGRRRRRTGSSGCVALHSSKASGWRHCTCSRRFFLCLVVK